MININSNTVIVSYKGNSLPIHISNIIYAKKNVNLLELSTIIPVALLNPLPVDLQKVQGYIMHVCVYFANENKLNSTVELINAMLKSKSHKEKKLGKRRYATYLSGFYDRDDICYTSDSNDDTNEEFYESDFIPENNDSE